MAKTDQNGSNGGDGDGEKRRKRPAFDPSSFSASRMASREAARAASKSGGGVVDEGHEAARPQAPFALGTVLEEAGLVNKEMIGDLISTGDEAGQSLRHSLVQQGIVDPDQILSAVAEDLGLERVRLRDLHVTPELLDLLPAKFVKKNRVFPVADEGDEIKVAISDPNNVSACDDLQMLLGKRVIPVIASAEELDRAIMKYYESGEITQLYEDFSKEAADPFGADVSRYDTVDLEGEDRDQRPEVRFVDLIFKQAIHDGASDIHIEPSRGGLQIRFRIDGVLQELPAPPRKWQNAIISRLKVLSGMDLAEKRVPQDGRIKLTLPDRQLDLRVSNLPSIFGETIVMRILDQADVLMGLEDVGFLPDSISMFQRLIRTPNGIILMTGPTGSGKTTTLNSALSTLNTPERKIITVEDPVEYQIQGINQIQVNLGAEVTFSVALRSMLRMSPDVIMVGEIRDVETGEIAISAALTGHLVFSTLHTNDAPSATVRLIDMGIKPFLVASSIQAVIAQRLLRRICSNCKRETSLPPDVIASIGADPKDYADQTFFHGTGCERCGNSGYRGRTAIHEIFVMTPELRKLVIRAESNARIKKTAVGQGMRTLRQDGWEKVVLGQTTAEEVMRITQLD